MENSSNLSHFDITKMKAIQNINEIQTLFNNIEEIYFTNYKTERNEILKTSIMSLLQYVDSNLQNSNQLSKEEISYLYFIKSLSLDKLPEYSKESEESASKSVSPYFTYIISPFYLYIVKTKSLHRRQLQLLRTYHVEKTRHRSSDQKLRKSI